MRELFVLNIGNTRAVGGVFDAGAIRDIRSWLTAELRIEELPTDLPIAIACVVPAARAKIERAGVAAFWVSPQVPCGLSFEGFDASTLGADRLANALALVETVALPALCVDCGTAITVEMVDATKKFLGGAIAPGRRLSRNAIGALAAALPDVPLYPTPPEALGKNTADAIRAGVDRGAVGLVRELIAAARRELNAPNCPALITGGDRDFFVGSLSDVSPAPEDFTLRGVAAAWRFHNLRFEI